MKLHECLHRRVTLESPAGAERIQCELVSQLLDQPARSSFAVDVSACSRCGESWRPSAARLNPVVASLVYAAADDVLSDSGRTHREKGKALQAKAYALPALSEICQQEVPQPGAAPGNFSQRTRPGRLSGACRSVSVRLRWRRQARVGLVGYNTPSGLGYLNRDLVTTGIADRWLVVTHPRLPTLDFPAAACEVDVAPPNITDRWIRRWLRGLDWVVCAELPCFRSLPELARTVGVRLALIPMWEAVSPSTEWIRLVDLLICPTRHSYGLFEDWKKRFGFTWSIRHIAWPVASDRFRFRQRGRCEQVVFINGGGGALARSVDGAPLCGRRKGADVVAEVARLTPEIPWIVYSQTDDVPSWPANVTVRPPPPDNADLYAAGDLCVQPSRWEGVGLPLIECQAAGIPLITTDAPPMNEHQPLCAIPPQRWDLGFVQEGQPVSIPVFDPQLWAQAVRERFGTDLSVASLAARQFVVQQRNWKTAAAAMRALFEPASRRGAN